MFDLGWTELLVIGVVALIVVGPKDLPGMFRTLGRFTAKLRGMAREFSRAMEAAADEAGVKEVSKDLKSMTSSKKLGLDAVEAAAKKFDSWDKTETTDPVAKGPETAKMTEERRAAAEKIREASAKSALERQAREAEAAAEPAPEAAPTAPEEGKT